jgi:phosphatidate cytidylyltransferase
MKVSDIFVFSNFILFFLLIINSAISDSSAYIVGSSIGKTPLFPDISPNKSLEGFFGGLGACFLFGTGIYFVFEIPASFIIVLVIGSFFAFVGDYFFSFLKRKSGIKDTGNILPGHGGLLDRIDSHLASFPVLILLIILLYS